jgi:hypothetical protein
MFHSGGGTWKEFGLANTGNYTVFPFWMFTIIWAILSYALATLGSMFFASVALKSMNTSSNLDLFTPVSQASPPTTGVTSRLPGYYVLETAGQPRYVYYGTEPPKV